MGSARFLLDGMYLSEIMMEAGIREDIIWQRQSF